MIDDGMTSLLQIQMYQMWEEESVLRMKKSVRIVKTNQFQKIISTFTHAVSP